MMCRHSAEDAQGGIAASMTNFREMLRGREAGESSQSIDAAL